MLDFTDKGRTSLVGRIVDSENVLFETSAISIDEEKGTPEFAVTEKAIRDTLYRNCLKRLEKVFPEHDNVNAYWNDSFSDIDFSEIEIDEDGEENKDEKIIEGEEKHE